MNVVYLNYDVDVSAQNKNYGSLHLEKILYTCPSGKIAKILTGPVGNGRQEIACANYDARNNSIGNIEVRIGEDLVVLYGHANNSHLYIAPLPQAYADNASQAYSSIKSDRTFCGWAVFQGGNLMQNRFGSDLILFPGETISIRSSSSDYYGQVVVNMKIIEDDLN